MTCFLYALWKDSCYKQLTRELMFHVREHTNKYVSMKTSDSLMSDVE